MMKFRICLFALGASSFLFSGNILAEAIPVTSETYVNLANKMIPSVVNISTVTRVKGSPMALNSEEFLRKFFGDVFRNRRGPNPDDSDEGEDESQVPSNPSSRSRLPKAMSLGTGFVIDSSGLILTNNHVVADAEEIKISFTESTEEKPLDATVVGRDPEIDIALIKIKAKKDLVPVVLGESGKLRVGDIVIAVGNPFGQGHSVSHGLISGVGRPAPDFPLANYLQTDAPINPGNSGGPLVNIKGEVIGINNAIDARGQGMGYAIPIDLVKKDLAQLRSKGSVARGYIGVSVAPLTPEVAAKVGIKKGKKGPVVTHVFPGDPADKAGVKPYDVILELKGQEIKSEIGLIGVVTSIPVGETVPMVISRAGNEMTLKIKIGQRPGQQQLAKKGSEKQKEKKKEVIETGMTLENIDSETARELKFPEKTDAVVVTDVQVDSPAEKAGLMRGDIILEVEQKSTKDVDAFYAIVKAKKSYMLRVRRSDAQGKEYFSVLMLDLKE